MSFLTVTGHTRCNLVTNQPGAPPKRPINTLQKSINKTVSVRLKSDLEYRGKMANADTYMNLILLDAEESENGSKTANYGKVVIRGNNVLYVRIEDRL